MHGNVEEWCLDRGKFGDPNTYYFFSWDSNPKETETDPRGHAEGSSHIIRGGGFGAEVEGCSASWRISCPSGHRGGSTGFRLACPVDVAR